MKKNLFVVFAFILVGCAEQRVAPALRVPHGSTFGAGVGSYLQAVVADDGGDNATALAGYLGAVGEDPANVNLRQRGYELALLQGDVDTAVRLVATLDEATSDQNLPLLVRMVGNIQRGKLDAADALAGRLVLKNPTLLQVVAMQGFLDVVTHKKTAAEAVKMVEAVKVPAPLEGRANYYVAQLWLMGGERTKGREALEAAQKADPGMVWVARDLGTLYEQAGLVEKADAVYAAFYEKNPLTGMLTGVQARRAHGGATALQVAPVSVQVGRVMLDFGLLAWTQGAAVPARQLLALSDSLLQGDPYAAYYAGMVEEFGGDMKRAAVYYARAEKNEEMGLATQLRLADVAGKMGDEKGAQRRVAKLLEEHGDLAPVRLMAGEFAMGQKDYSAAVEHYKALEKLLPANTPAEARASVCFSLGAALERNGEAEEAAKWLKQSLKLAPLNAQVMNYLGYMWLEQGGHADEALELLRQAMVLAPNDGAVVDSVGWAYFTRGEYARALVYLERAAELEPDDATVAEHVGDVYDKLGRKEDAKRLWGQALELNKAEGQQDEVLVRRVKGKLGE